MTKLNRVHQKIFGKNATINQLAKIGSLAAGVPEKTDDPNSMQALPNYEGGFYDCVLGNNSPTIQDMNSLMFLVTRQIAYLMQQGIPEWHPSVDYHIGQFCAYNGMIYESLANDNVNANPASSPLAWRSYGAGLMSRGHVNVNSNYFITAEDHGKILLVNGSAGDTMSPATDDYYDYYFDEVNHPFPPPWNSMELPPGFPNDGLMMIFLPDEAPAPGFKVTIKDAGKRKASVPAFAGESFAENPVYLVPGRLRSKSTDMWTIEQQGAEYSDLYSLVKLTDAGGTYDLYFDGERWWVTSQSTFHTSAFNSNSSPYVISNASSVVHSTTSTSYVDVSNLSVDVQTRNRPIELSLIAGDPASYGRVGFTANAFGAGGMVAILKDDVKIAEFYVSSADSPHQVHTMCIPPGGFRCVDSMVYGMKHTYKVQVRVDGTGEISVVNCRLMAREI